jgi:hypothetical protein
MAEYRLVPGLPNYRVGDDGSIWACWKRVKRGPGNGNGTRLVPTPHWRQLHPKPEPSGYLRITAESRPHAVHSLVLLAFVGPCPPDLECRHLNGQRDENRLSNLVWGTSKENKADSIRHGTSFVTTEEKCGTHKLLRTDVLEIREYFAMGASAADLARGYDVVFQTIYKIAHGRRWTHSTGGPVVAALYGPDAPIKVQRPQRLRSYATNQG